MIAAAAAPTLYIWPELWDLPSWDVESLSALLHLQLAIPGRFLVVSTANPDSSPTGQLPYLTHGLHVVASYASISKYISTIDSTKLTTVDSHATPEGFSSDLDAILSPSERATRVAWAAHLRTVVGDLLTHVLYSLPENYTSLVHPSIARLYPAPQRYYVPHRLRALQAPRLDASGLWNLAGEEIEDIEAEKQQQARFSRDGKKPHQEPIDRVKIWKNAFFRDRVVERARLAFEPYAQLLENKRFFFYDRPTSLDVLLASSVLLLTVPPFPDPLIGDLLRTSFPSLIAHAQSVLTIACPHRPLSANFSLVPGESFSIRSLLPSLNLLQKGEPTSDQSRKKSEKEVQFERGTRLWMGAATIATLAYWMLAPPLAFRIVIRDDNVSLPSKEPDREIEQDGAVAEMDEVEEENEMDLNE